jgi:hypothetical protein
MPRVVMIDAIGIVARARAMMPQDLPTGAPHDAAVIRQQIAWAHAMILSGSRCQKSDPAFRARCAELLEVLDALRMAWACHFGRNWKTGQPVDPRLIHPTPLDDVILAARVGPFQLYRYEPVRRIARACNVIEATAERAEQAARPPMPQRPAARSFAEDQAAEKAAKEEARRKRAQQDLEAFRAGTLREIRFPDEGSKAWFSEADRMRNAFATREAMQPQRQRQRQRVRQR